MTKEEERKQSSLRDEIESIIIHADSNSRDSGCFYPVETTNEILKLIEKRIDEFVLESTRQRLLEIKNDR